MKKTQLSDTQLVQEYRRGNGEAIAELIKRYQSKVYSTIYLIVRDRYLAEDLTQDVFIKVIDKIIAGKYNEEGKFSHWIGRISHNLAIDYFRKNKRSPEILCEDGSVLFNTLDWLDKNTEDEQVLEETRASIRLMIDKLPENQKEVVMMRHFAEMSFQEIAEATGVGINTALGRMRYALLNLRKMYEEINKAYDKNPYPS